MSGRHDAAAPRFPLLFALVLGALAGITIYVIQQGAAGFAGFAPVSLLWHGLGGALFFLVVATIRNRFARRLLDAR